MATWETCWVIITGSEKKNYPLGPNPNPKATNKEGLEPRVQVDLVLLLLVEVAMQLPAPKKVLISYTLFFLSRLNRDCVVLIKHISFLYCANDWRWSNITLFYPVSLFILIHVFGCGLNVVWSDAICVLLPDSIWIVAASMSILMCLSSWKVLPSSYLHHPSSIIIIWNQPNWTPSVTSKSIQILTTVD